MTDNEEIMQKLKEIENRLDGIDTKLDEVESLANSSIHTCECEPYH